MTMWDELEDIRDLLRTGLAPMMANISQEQWPSYKCERAASRIDVLIKRHEEAIGGTKAEREKKRQLQKRAQLRNRYRNSVCSGCYNNRYNFESAGDGWNAPTSGDGCWSLPSIRNGRCPVYRSH